LQKHVFIISCFFILFTWHSYYSLTHLYTHSFSHLYTLLL
jgi:hypothetical protein